MCGTMAPQNYEILYFSDIDLLYTHVWDYGTPLEETLETLHWLVQQGKVDQVMMQKVSVQ